MKSKQFAFFEAVTAFLINICRGANLKCKQFGLLFQPPFDRIHACMHAWELRNESTRSFVTNSVHSRSQLGLLTKSTRFTHEVNSVHSPSQLGPLTKSTRFTHQVNSVHSPSQLGPLTKSTRFTHQVNSVHSPSQLGPSFYNVRAWTTWQEHFYVTKKVCEHAGSNASLQIALMYDLNLVLVFGNY